MSLPLELGVVWLALQKMLCVLPEPYHQTLYGALVKVESTYFCNPKFTPSLMIVGIHLGVERQCEVKVLVEGNNTTTEIRLKPPTSRLKVQHANHRTTALHNISTCAISYFLNITLSLMPYMVTIARAILVDDSISLAAPNS